MCWPGEGCASLSYSYPRDTSQVVHPWSNQVEDWWWISQYYKFVLMTEKNSDDSEADIVNMNVNIKVELQGWRKEF